MNTLTELMIDIPVQPARGQEEKHIDPNKEYFAVTPRQFLIYAKQKMCWHCLRTGLVIPGNISDVIDENGDMYLHVDGLPVNHGKWATAGNLDDIMDLYNSGQYLEWLKMQK